ncbi:MAG: hypothetical protein ACI8VE_002872 [Natrialbaceae archaeon]|jgi:hypothetical protein
MHATVDVRLEITIDDDKTLTLGTLASEINDQEIEAKIVESVVQEADSQSIQEYCGEKYERGNGTKRFQRAGTTTRTATISAGTHEFRLHQAKDTEKNRYFRPVENIITFDGKKHYQEDISMHGVDLATKLSYRDAVEEGERFTQMPSKTTINRRVKEYGTKLREFLTEAINGTQSACVQDDGTKCHSQEIEVNQHDIHVTLDSANESLLDVRVNESWDDTAKELDDADAVADDATVVSDADSSLHDAFVTEDRTQQLDLVHLVRTTGYNLWKDAELTLDERKRVLDSVKEAIYPLTWAVEKARSQDDPSRLRRQIENTVETIQRIASNLSSLGCPQAAGYLRRCSNRAVTFARLALEEVQVPWTSNRIERLMGEISKRCKHQWMSWTTSGLDSLLRLILTRTTNPAEYERFKRKMTHRSDQKYISTEVSVEDARGEF